MASAEELIAVVGLPVDSPAVQTLIAADGLAELDESEGLGIPSRGYLSSTTAGYALTFELNRVTNAALYAEPAEGFVAFPGRLPGGLGRGATRLQVLGRFGVPERSGEPFHIPGLGLQGAWDRFAVGEVRIHFQYTVADGVVRLVSVMAADVAP